MTVSTTQVRVSYIGDGSSTSFSIPYPFYLNTDLTILLGSAVQSNGYSITGGEDANGNPQRGTVVFATAPASGVAVQFILNVPLSQLVKLVDGTAFPSSTLNQVNDRAIQAMLRFSDIFNRSIVAPDGDVAPNFTLPSALTRANTFMGFDATGNISLGKTLPSGTLSQSSIGLFLYPQTAAESAVGVTPANYAYPASPSIDPRRYGARFDNFTDDSAAWTTALKVASQFGISGNSATVIHPGGTSIWASQVLAGNNFSIQGYDRTACVIQYVGGASSSALRITNNGTANPIPNSSNFGRVNVSGVCITTSIADSTAGAIEINACGFAFYNIISCRLTGSFKYGAILDGVEVTTVNRNIIDNVGPANSSGIWIVNGPDRTPLQAQGYTNSVWIENNQINGQVYNIADDGGSNHYILRNNLNGAAQLPIRMAGVQGFQIHGNELENALGGLAQGEANIDFLTLTLAGVSAGGCQAGSVVGNYLGADMASGSWTINFGGSAMHSAIDVKNNWFRNNAGRAASINVSQLSNSFCGLNYHSENSGFVYSGTHNDANGNTLYPPQNGAPSGLIFAEAAYLFGDSRYGISLQSGLAVNGVGTISPQLTGWGTPSGASVQANFAGATATLAQTSAAVAEIITFLKSVGFFGT